MRCSLGELDEVTPAFATTIHTSQGSESSRRHSDPDPALPALYRHRPRQAPGRARRPCEGSPDSVDRTCFPASCGVALVEAPRSFTALVSREEGGCAVASPAKRGLAPTQAASTSIKSNGRCFEGARPIGGGAAARANRGRAWSAVRRWKMGEPPLVRPFSDAPYRFIYFRME